MSERYKLFPPPQESAAVKLCNLRVRMLEGDDKYVSDKANLTAENTKNAETRRSAERLDCGRFSAAFAWHDMERTTPKR